MSMAHDTSVFIRPLVTLTILRHLWFGVHKSHSQETSLSQTDAAQTCHSGRTKERYRERKSAFTTDTVWFPGLKFAFIFQIKYMEAILSYSTRKLLLFEITKVLIAV